MSTISRWYVSQLGCCTTDIKLNERADSAAPHQHPPSHQHTTGRTSAVVHVSPLVVALVDFRPRANCDFGDFGETARVEVRLDGEVHVEVAVRVLALVVVRPRLRHGREDIPGPGRRERDHAERGRSELAEELSGSAGRRRRRRRATHSLTVLGPDPVLGELDGRVHVHRLRGVDARHDGLHRCHRVRHIQRNETQRAGRLAGVSAGHTATNAYDAHRGGRRTNEAGRANKSRVASALVAVILEARNYMCAPHSSEPSRYATSASTLWIVVLNERSLTCTSQRPSTSAHSHAPAPPAR